MVQQLVKNDDFCMFQTEQILVEQQFCFRTDELEKILQIMMNL
jgi:hypothetical protein